MNLDGSMATTWAPLLAASTDAGPIPAPISKTFSPFWGSTIRITSLLKGERQNFGSFSNHEILALTPLSCSCLYLSNSLPNFIPHF